MPEKDDKILVTEAGLNELKEQLEYLKTTKRYEVAERIKVALGYGDLSENAEYDEAKSEQGFVEGQIRDLEEKIQKSVVISEDEIQTDKISVGSTVRLMDLEDEEEVKYQIVGSAESDLKKNRISNASPVGKGLIGHRVGETVSIDVPMGEVKYKILEIGR